LSKSLAAAEQSRRQSLTTAATGLAAAGALPFFPYIPRRLRPTAILGTPALEFFNTIGQKRTCFT